MSLTQEAIKEVKSLSVTASSVFIDNVKATDNKVAILPNGTHIESLEGFNKCRDDFRGQFYTENVNSFIDYNKNQNGDSPACFIDAEKMKARTIFDLGTKEKPLHCQHSASLALSKTSDYESLLKVADHIGQKILSDFIEDWSDNITCFSEASEDGEQSIIVNRFAVQAVRKVTIKASSETENEIGAFKEQASVFQSVEAKSGDLSKKLPELIVFKCAPYNGLKEYTFNVRVSVITSNAQPLFSLRIVNHEKQCDEMVEEFMSIITEKLSETEIKTYIGNFNS